MFSKFAAQKTCPSVSDMVVSMTWQKALNDEMQFRRTSKKKFLYIEMNLVSNVICNLHCVKSKLSENFYMVGR